MLKEFYLVNWAWRCLSDSQTVWILQETWKLSLIDARRLHLEQWNPKLPNTNSNKPKEVNFCISV